MYLDRQLLFECVSNLFILKQFQTQKSCKHSTENVWAVPQSVVYDFEISEAYRPFILKTVPEFGFN